MKKHFTKMTPSSLHHKPIVLVLFFMLAPVFHAVAQYGTKASIKNVNFELIDNKVIITYDLLKAKSRDLFDINLSIYSTSGYKIDAQTIEGEFTNIRKGKKKEIKWDIGKDYNFFDDNIYVELTAFHKNHMVVDRVPRLEAMFKSTIWPGWGSAQTSLKKANYAKGFLAYGFLTTAAISYKLYQQENNTSDADLYIIASRVALGMAAVVWVWDYGKILFSPNVSRNIKLDIEASNYKNNISPMLALKINL